jgi:hypothetical protein
MKKIILFISLTHFLTIIKSQTDFSAKIGVNLVHLGPEVLVSNKIVGYQVGLSSSFYLNKNFIFKPELILSKKGGELKDKIPASYGYTEYLKTEKTYLDLPLLLRFKLTTNNKLDFFINSGIIVGYCIWTNELEKGGDEIKRNIGPISDNAFNSSFIIGAGLIFFEITDLEFRYEFGLTDVLVFKNETYSNRLVSITLSYRLNKKRNSL